MATNLFLITPYDSFRWVKTGETSPYNSFPLEQANDQDYFQPWQCGGGDYQADKGQIQLISDFVPEAGLYTFAGALVAAVPMIPIDPPILGTSFICYNGEVNFGLCDPGTHYVKMTYTDENDEPQERQTWPLDVQIYHEGTQLIEATNTRNDKGVVFVKADNSTLEFNFRVRSIVRQPIPKTDAEDYEDQYNTLTQENSIPFANYTQLIGGPVLLPFWVIEKINLLYSLNKVKIDGYHFAKVAKSEFKPTRADVQPQGAWWEVDIQPNEAYPADVFTTGTPPEGDYIVIKRCQNFNGITDDFALSGVFNVRKNLIRLYVENIGLDNFTLKVGTSRGIANIAQFDISNTKMVDGEPVDNVTNSLDIGVGFRVPTDIWLSGLSGTNCDITFDWNDYLAKNVTPDTSAAKWQKSTLYWFVELPGGELFTDEFDVATGLGRADTDHEGCVLAGTNGTPSLTGMVVQGWNNAEVLPTATRQTEVGDNSITLSLAQLPEHRHFILNGDSQNTSGNDITPSNGYARMQRNAGINRDYNIAASMTEPDRGPTSKIGAGDPIDITNHALILPAFYYIGV